MTDPHEPAEDPSRTTMKPFLIAVSIVGIVMIGMIVSALVRPAEDSRTPADRLTASVGDFVRASNNDDADAVKTMTCPEFAADRSPIAGRDGGITVLEVGNPQVDGSRATAEVRIDAGDGRGPATSTWTFVQGKDRWLICD